jgi:AcrR family transcriptional regulator
VSTTAENPPLGGGVTGRHPRRSTAEVRTRLLDAAHDFFRDRGFTGASVRDIAARADVKESVLFRHFGSKAVLFQRSVLEPIIGFCESYTARWVARESVGAEPGELIEGWLGGMYTLATRHRELILALMAAQAFEPEHFGTTVEHPELAELLRGLTEVTDLHRQAHGLHLADPEITTRVSFAMVLGLALLDPWVFPPGTDRPDSQRIIAELVDFQMHGVTHRPPVQRPATSPAHPDPEHEKER